MNPANWPPTKGPTYRLPDGVTVRIGMPKPGWYTAEEIAERDVFRRAMAGLLPKGTSKGLPWYRRIWLWLKYRAW